MCSSGAPFLCCGKSNRHRCVPFTSLIQSAGASCAETVTRPHKGEADGGCGERPTRGNCGEGFVRSTTSYATPLWGPAPRREGAGTQNI